MNVPHNSMAERDVLGAMMLNAEALRVGLRSGLEEDFYDQFHAQAFSAMRSLFDRGGPVNASSVADEISLHVPGDPGAYRVRLLEMMTNVVSTLGVGESLSTVARHAAGRQVLRLCQEAVNGVSGLQDPFEVSDQLTASLAGIEVPLDRSVQEAVTMDELLSMSEADTPWVVPGMFRSDWRVLVVAGEGTGKSVMLRQIAMMAAQGLHPFHYGKIKPVRSLVVDLENPLRAIAETGERMSRRLKLELGDEYDSTRCRFWMQPQGLDLRNRQARYELEREIALHEPDLLTIGPAYRMTSRKAQRNGAESYEEATEPVLYAIDDLRTRYGFAVLIEHHAAKGYGGSRDLSPYGSQRWMAWPDIGISLKMEQGVRNSWTLDRHRGDRMVVQWPDRVSHGDAWPWVGTWDKPENMPRRAKEDVPF